MKPPFKRVLEGALVAASGAFVWATITFSAEKGQGDSFFSVLAFAAYAVLLASWFVLPLGGIIGVLMPTVARGSSRFVLLRGTLIGIAAAVVAAGITKLTFSSESGSFIKILATMIPICVLWIGVWTYHWNRKIAMGS
jgi:hypothetical protein